MSDAAAQIRSLRRVSLRKPSESRIPWAANAQTEISLTWAHNCSYARRTHKETHDRTDHR